MGDQVQRMVERAEASTTPIGSWWVKASRPAEAALRSIGISTPAWRPQVLGAEPDAVDRPIGLDQGIHQRFSAFAGGFQGELLPPLLHDGRGAREDFDASGRAEPGVAVAEEGVGRGQGTLDAGAVHLLDRGDRRAIERRGDHRRLRPPPWRRGPSRGSVPHGFRSYRIASCNSDAMLATAVDERTVNPDVARRPHGLSSTVRFTPGTPACSSARSASCSPNNPPGNRPRPRYCRRPPA